MAGSRTRVNCLEGSYANRYTTNACCVSAVYLLTKYRAWQQVKVNKCPYSVLLAIRKEHLLHSIYLLKIIDHNNIVISSFLLYFFLNCLTSLNKIIGITLSTFATYAIFLINHFMIIQNKT